jgi:hypothetical protein
MQTLKTRTTRRKRRLALFVAVIMTLTLWTAVPMQASAADPVDGTLVYTNTDGFKYTVTNGEATITAGYTGVGGTVTIPPFVIGDGDSPTIPVTAIDANAFKENTNIVSISIPDSVKTIGGEAFLDATQLATVTLTASSSLTSIGGGAFARTPLVSINIPNGVTSIGSYTFMNCTSLASINIPDGVTSIGAYAFQQCPLTSFTIPPGLTSLSDGVLQLTKLTSINIPEGVTSIGVGAFNQCSELQSVTVPASVKEIKDAAFQHCTQLTTVNIPDGITVINAQTFNGDKALETIAIPDSVTNIRAFAFQNCEKLKSITIPKAVTTISNSVFLGCKALTSIVIPENVTSIDYEIVNGASAITDVTILGENPSFNANTFAGIPSSAKVWLYASNTNGKTSLGNKATAVIMIEAPVLNETSPITLDKDNPNNNTKQLSVTSFLPGNQGESAIADPTSTAKWSSSNEDVAFVGENTGTVTAKAPGTVLITVTVKAQGGDKTASIPVTVTGSGATYALTVTDGEYVGTGPFVKDAKVTIVADPPISTQVFDKWTGADASSFADPTSSTTVFTMPDAAATVTATYKNIRVLTVTNGSGSGSYVSGKEVAISADAAPSGKVFDTWTTSNGGNFTDATNADTTFTMPDDDVTVTATYKVDSVTPPPAQTTYAVTVTGGTDGANGTYAEGATVNITANAPTSGKVFDKWTSSDGVAFADASKASTSFVMPAKAVTVTATYKDEAVNPPVNPPVADDGWVYANGVWKFYADGEVATGWIHDGKAWYYTNVNGEMQTGWIHDGKAWYYLAGNGAMKTGWQKDNGSWYYLSGNGAMVASTWFHDTDGSWYYLSGNGKMLTGKHNIGGKAYTFKSNGAWIG